MKKIITLLFLGCMLTGMTACGGQENQEPDKNVENPVVQTEEQMGETEEAEETEQIITEESVVRTLAMDKAKFAQYQWDEEAEQLLVHSKYSKIILGESERQLYPELAESIDQLAVMQKRSMEEEFDNMAVTANEIYQEDSSDFETYRITKDVQLRRADTVAVSILEAYYAKAGETEEYRGMNGLNFDTQTGQQLKIADVITDMSKVPELVKKEINSHSWNADFYSESAVEDYFKEINVEDLSWTLDYNGVTFYFQAGSFADEGFGNSAATLNFEEYPELFQEKYKKVPEAYMVRMPVGASFFVNLDRESDLEELVFEANYDSFGRYYYDFGIYSDQDADYYYEECYAYDFNPYFVKTIDGRNYLYLFHEQEEDLNRHMMLYVYEVSHYEFEKIGEMDMGPYYKQVGDEFEDVFVIPTDPHKFYVDDFSDYSRNYSFDYGVYEQMEPVECFIGGNGMPQRADLNTVYVDSAEAFLEAVAPQTNIILQPGYYNFSECLEELWEKGEKQWNKSHPYVKLQECYDGTEVVIRDVNQLYIGGIGESPLDTIITVDPRYAKVFNFENCKNLTFNNLTMGHTETGVCFGNVLDFYNCKVVSVNNMDLYGCGVFGFGAFDGSGDFTILSTAIHDCSDGVYYIEDGEGFFVFSDCILTDNGGYSHFEESEQTSLAFLDCYFGKYETEHFYTMENVYMEGCFWEQEFYQEPEIYYDIEPTE